MQAADLPLPLAMLIVFGSAKLMAEVFERLHQPGIVGEIIAGVVIGPSVLGWVAPHDTLKALADLGVMFLLWVAVLHAPRVATHLHNGDEWSSAFVALAMCGASFIVAGTMAKKS